MSPSVIAVTYEDRNRSPSSSTLTSVQSWLARSSDDVISKYVNTLREDPPAVKRWFLTLYRAKRKGAGRNRDPTFCQLAECFARTHDLRKERTNTRVVIPRESAFLRDGVALMVSAGLPKVFVDVVGEYGFVDEDPGWTHNILACLVDVAEMCVGRASKDASVPLVDELLTGSDAIWETLWARRRDLMRGVDVVAEEEMRAMLAELLQNYQRLYNIRRRSATLLSGRTADLIFFLWYHAPVERLSARCPEVFYFITRRLPLTPTEMREWSQRAVVPQFSATKVLQRFTRELEDPRVGGRHAPLLPHSYVRVHGRAP